MPKVMNGGIVIKRSRADVYSQVVRENPIKKKTRKRTVESQNIRKEVSGVALMPPRQSWLPCTAPGFQTRSIG